MNDEPALRLLRDLKTECPGPHPSLEEAERAVRHVAFMDQVVRSNRRRTRVVSHKLSLAAAFALLAFGIARYERQAKSPTVTPTEAALGASVASPNRVTPISGSLRISNDSAGERELSSSAPLLRGERVSLGAKAQAVVQLANGALATLAEQSSLTLEGTSQDQALRLANGHVELSVPPLSPHSLSVVTSNARVTVVGTKFSVTVEPGTDQGDRTCVNVTEGRVSVTTASSSVLLSAGARWSSDDRGCAAGAVEPSAAPPKASARLHAPPATARAVSGRKPAEESQSSSFSLLAEQNRLFAAALQARQAGDRMHARALFGELLERFPDAALAPQARRELQKLDQQGGVSP